MRLSRPASFPLLWTAFFSSWIYFMVWSDHCFSRKRKQNQSRCLFRCLLYCHSKDRLQQLQNATEKVTETIKTSATTYTWDLSVSWNYGEKNNVIIAVKDDLAQKPTLREPPIYLTAVVGRGKKKLKTALESTSLQRYYYHFWPCWCLQMNRC